MSRMRGWGLLLALGMPLLIFFSWSHLGSEKSRINLERFEAWAGSNSTGLAWPLAEYFVKNRKLVGPGDVPTPPIPKNSGVKAWSVQPDATLLVELDAVVDGRAVLLTYVPIVRSATSVFYDCMSTTSAAQVGRFCRSEVVRSESGIPAQLAANAQMLLTMPAVVSATAGSVVVVPEKVSDLDGCGFQCVKPQSCVTPRPLACSKMVDEGNSRRFDIAASSSDFPGNSFATRSEADRACEQSLGAGYKVLGAASINGPFKLTGGNEYWVQNDVRPESNCWKTDYR